MPDQLEGSALAAAIALEVMGWHKKFLEGDCNRMKWFWSRSDRQAVHLVDKWRPDTDPTTFFRDVVPAVNGRCLLFSSYQYPDRSWRSSFHDGTTIPKITSNASHANIATAGCLAALAAVRSRKAAEAAEEETNA